jgi:hypothetical protein
VSVPTIIHSAFSSGGTFNTQVEHRIGLKTANNTALDGYLAEVNFIDGQALTPSDFGEADEDYGDWKPKAYTGTYGTNGFHLDFKTSGTLGNDANGSNNWTTNNLASTDQMIDTPTNNFCTWNSLGEPYGTRTLAEGNLKTSTNASSWDDLGGTIAPNSGKWYFEFLLTNTSGSSVYGVCDSTTDELWNGDLNGVHAVGDDKAGYSDWGTVYQTTGSQTLAAWNTSPFPVMGVTFDVDTQSVQFYKGGVSVGSAITTTNATMPFCSNYGGSVSIANFGQDSSFAGTKTAGNNSDSNGIGDFYYAPPTGFLALCTKNLPYPTVIPTEHFNTVLYTGTNNTAQDITTVGFQPDLVWAKSTNTTSWHYLHDSVRGANNSLSSNYHSIEDTATGQLDSFLSNGFELPADSGGYINFNGRTYVAWNWKAGNATLGTGDFTQGSRPSTCSRNLDAGFSIVSYQGYAGAKTIGHGLDKAPEMIFIKNRDNSSGYAWDVYAKPITAAKYMALNSTAPAGTSSGRWNNLDPTSSVINLGTSGSVGGTSAVAGDEFIAYCFHSVDGYSKVGIYNGTSSTTNATLVPSPFVYLGFRPAYVMIKEITTGTSNGQWNIFDNDRSTYNPTDDILWADTTAGESSDNTYNNIDFLSNGFKINTAWGAASQINYVTDYLYIAFAEMPFKWARGQ